MNRSEGLNVLEDIACLVSWLRDNGVSQFRIADACCQWQFKDGRCPEWATSWPTDDGICFNPSLAPEIIRKTWGKVNKPLCSSSRDILRQEYPQYDDSQWTQGVHFDGMGISVSPDGWTLVASTWICVHRDYWGCSAFAEVLEEMEGFVHWHTSGERWDSEIKVTTKLLQ